VSAVEVTTDEDNFTDGAFVSFSPQPKIRIENPTSKNVLNRFDAALILFLQR
jgi:hypothetical protein